MDPVLVLADQLAAEGAELDRLLADGGQLSTPTPAQGWTVRDTIVHLHRSDQAGQGAVSEAPSWPDQLGRHALAVLEPDYAGPDPRLLTDWRAGRAELTRALLALPRGTRVPWFGPSMGVRSFLTARLMETWAHGQDIADAFGAHRSAGPRLRAVAELGVRTRAWSYAVRGRAQPDTAVFVALEPPQPGPRWEWGPPDAPDRVCGPALDFCLLVTQRRHRDELALEIRGAAAVEWMTIAQAFAGAPTTGRPAPGARPTGR